VETIVAAGGGFLLAVLWFDLMFDVQARSQCDAELPESVLASIAGYYRRVTTTARPMNLLVAVVMLGTLTAIVVEIANDDVAAWVGWTSLALVVMAITIAVVDTVPGAVRLGARGDAADEQSRVARAILREHSVCFALIGALVALQLASAAT
jgi:hypothetical protein